jgi:divalent metal cation (Fe/Co/Zn/Cd) transporter
MIGLVVALGAVSLSTITDDPIYDGWGSVVIGSLLVVIAVVLAIEMKSLLIGESASSAMEAAIRDAIESTDDVVGLIHVRTQHIGPDELLVGAKVQFRDTLSVADLAAAINRVEERLRSTVPAARVVYIEPDVHDPALQA